MKKLKGCLANGRQVVAQRGWVVVKAGFVYHTGGLHRVLLGRRAQKRPGSPAERSWARKEGLARRDSVWNRSSKIGDSKPDLPHAR